MHPRITEVKARFDFEHYEAQTDEEAIAEDEAAFDVTSHTVMEIPVDLVRARQLLAKRRTA